MGADFTEQAAAGRMIVGVGTRVSYEDMANPLREGSIVGEVAGQWAVRWDEDAAVYPLTEAHGLFFHTTVTKQMLDRAQQRQAENEGRRVAGWNVYPTLPHMDRDSDNPLEASIARAREPRTMLVHLNVEVPHDSPLTASDIEKAADGVISVGAEGLDGPEYDGTRWVIASVEEV